LTDSGERVKKPRNPHEIADQQTSSREGELHEGIQAGGAGVMASQRPERGEGGGGARDPPAAALPLGADRARARGVQAGTQDKAQPGTIGGREPTFTGGEREAPGAA